MATSCCCMNNFFIVWLVLFELLNFMFIIGHHWAAVNICLHCICTLPNSHGTQTSMPQQTFITNRWKKLVCNSLWIPFEFSQIPQRFSSFWTGKNNGIETVFFVFRLFGGRFSWKKKNNRKTISVLQSFRQQIELLCWYLFIFFILHWKNVLLRKLKQIKSTKKKSFRWRVLFTTLPCTMHALKCTLIFSKWNFFLLIYWKRIFKFA